MIKPATIDFGLEYMTRRDRFRAAAHGAGAWVETLAHPKLNGPDRFPLTIDVARLGPDDARHLIIVSSGTHGIEGLIGSDIQSDALETRLMEPLPRDTAVLHVHALNPYGFMTGRRVNENNVDINRNCIDWTKPLPQEHPLTEEVIDILVPQEWNWPWMKVAGVILRNGFPAAQAAMTQGQYRLESGLFFGGVKQEWSSIAWHSIVKGHAISAKKITHIDLHTGLGPRGHGEMMVMDAPNDPAFARAKALWSDVTSTYDGSAVSSRLTGDINQAFNRVATHAEVTSATLEFGTVPKLTALRALAMDNWAHVRGRLDTPEGIEAKLRIRAAFAPADPKWEAAALARGRQILKASINNYS